MIIFEETKKSNYSSCRLMNVIGRGKRTMDHFNHSFELEQNLLEKGSIKSSRRYKSLPKLISNTLYSPKRT